MHKSVERHLHIDILRVIGGLTVMAAHVPLPAWFFQLRNFGTPLMVVVSALATSVLFRRGPLPTLPFLARRLRKVVLEPWVFLAVFFCGTFLLAQLRHKPFPFSSRDVLDSFTFEGGIGYVWIFRVYILVALMTPFILRLRGCFADPLRFLRFLFVLLLLDEGAWAVYAHATATPDRDGSLWPAVFAVAPYMALFGYGLSLGEMSRRSVSAIGGAALLLFAALAALHAAQAGHFVPTQEEKYPPTLYYLSYAVACINAIYLLAQGVRGLPDRARAAVTWASTHMLWIYLWHVLCLHLWSLLVGTASGGLALSALELAAVVATACVMTRVQMAVRHHAGAALRGLSQRARPWRSGPAAG